MKCKVTEVWTGHNVDVYFQYENPVIKRVHVFYARIASLYERRLAELGVSSFRVSDLIVEKVNELGELWQHHKYADFLLNGGMEIHISKEELEKIHPKLATKDATLFLYLL